MSEIAKHPHARRRPHISGHPMLVDLVLALVGGYGDELFC